MAIENNEKFSWKTFSNNMTIDYLEKCNLTCADRKQIFEMFDEKIFDSNCIKYMIDCYGERKYVWDEYFDYIWNGTKETMEPMQYVYKSSNVELILYMLDVCDRCNLSIVCDVFWCENNCVCPFEYFCYMHRYMHRHVNINMNVSDVQISQLVLTILNRMLDIFIKKNIGFGKGSIYGSNCRDSLNPEEIDYTPYPILQCVIMTNNCALIKRSLDAYADQNIKFDFRTLSSYLSLDWVDIKNYDSRTKMCIYKYYMSLEQDIFS